MDNFKMILYADKELVYGKTEKNIQDCGKIIKWMDKVNFYGLMEKNILV
jgi:hypothetical protein